MARNSGRKINSKEQFAQIASKGHVLFCQNSWKAGGEDFLLKYVLYPSDKFAYEFVLTIEEGSLQFDHGLDVCSCRDARIYFVDIASVIEYLEKKESFNCHDWKYTKEPFTHNK